MKTRVIVASLLVAVYLVFCIGAEAQNDTVTTPALPDTPVTTKTNSSTIAVTQIPTPNTTTPATNGSTTNNTQTPTLSTTNMTHTPQTNVLTEGPNTTSMVTTLQTTLQTSAQTTSVTQNSSAPQTTPTSQTTPTLPTTASAQTTPTLVMPWRVLSGNSTCQLMQFSQFAIKYYNTSGLLDAVTVSIPPAGQLSNVTGDCSSREKRTFSLTFFPNNGSDAEPWKLQFVFKNFTLNTYRLSSVGIELVYDDRFDTTKTGHFSYSFISPSSPLAGVGAPFGKAFYCANQQVSTADEQDGISVVFENLWLQPFADQTQGKFGEGFGCPYKPDSPNIPDETGGTSWRIATIVVCTIFGVFFVGTVAFCWYVKKHRAQPSDTYSLMETY